MRAIFILLLFALIGCSESEELKTCTDGFPKVYGNQEVLDFSIDVYAYDAGNLTLVRSFDIEATPQERVITLTNDSESTDSTYPPTVIDYERIDGCMVDWRQFEQKSWNSNCTSLTINQIGVSINGGTTVTPSFEGDCNKTEEALIQEAIDYLEENNIPFDSIYVDKFRVELKLID